MSTPLTLPAKTTGDTHTATEYMQVRDALQVGTLSIKTETMEMTSTTEGFKPPQLTNAQRPLPSTLSAIDDGMVIFNTTTRELQTFIHDGHATREGQWAYVDVRPFFAHTFIGLESASPTIPANALSMTLNVPNGDAFDYADYQDISTTVPLTIDTVPLRNFTYEVPAGTPNTLGEFTYIGASVGFMPADIVARFVIDTSATNRQVALSAFKSEDNGVSWTCVGMPLFYSAARPNSTQTYTVTASTVLNRDDKIKFSAIGTDAADVDITLVRADITIS